MRQNDFYFSKFTGPRINLDEPACCFDDIVTNGEPKSCPFSAGLVVKKGLNILSLISGGIPVPRCPGF